MTPEEYKRIIAYFGFTQMEAGVWLGLSAKTGQNYATRGPPAPVAKLLRMMVRLNIKPEELK
jgi:hypothetical protein